MKACCAGSTARVQPLTVMGAAAGAVGAAAVAAGAGVVAPTGGDDETLGESAPPSVTRMASRRQDWPSQRRTSSESAWPGFPAATAATNCSAFAIRCPSMPMTMSLGIRPAIIAGLFGAAAATSAPPPIAAGASLVFNPR